MTPVGAAEADAIDDALGTPGAVIRFRATWQTEALLRKARWEPRLS